MSAARFAFYTEINALHMQDGLLHLSTQSQEHGGDIGRPAFTRGELSTAIEGPCACFHGSVSLSLSRHLYTSLVLGQHIVFCSDLWSMTTSAWVGVSS